ncbi:MAG: FecR family protein [Planctomycetota bacterium]
MKEPNDIPREIEDALALFFDNQASPEVCRTIHDWLEEEPSVNATIFAEYATVDRMIYEAQKTEDASAVFALLAEMEAAAEAELVVIQAEPKKPLETAKAGVRFAGKSIGKNTNIVIPKSLFYGGLAAVLLLGAGLLWAFIGGQAGVEPGSTPPDQVAEQTQSLDKPEQRQQQSTEPTPESKPTPAALVARVTGGYQASWSQPPVDGKITADQSLELTAGFAELSFSDGARVLIQAPAKIQPLTPISLRLRSGKLFATTEASGDQFIVHTPNLRLTDLGTSFGVSVDPLSGKTSTYVYSGKVHAVPVDEHGQAKGEGLMLVEDQSGTYETGSTVQPGGADRHRFVTESTEAPYIVHHTGQAKYVGRTPVNETNLDEFSSDRYCFIMLEHTGFSPRIEFDVAITEPGLYESFIDLSKPLYLDTPVDSYLVRLNTASEELVTLTGQVTFPRPVVAILASTDQRLETDELFALPDSDLSTQDGDGLEPFKPLQLVNQLDDGDSIRLSDDRRTIDYRLAAKNIDQFRVLIQGVEDQP